LTETVPRRYARNSPCPGPWSKVLRSRAQESPRCCKSEPGGVADPAGTGWHGIGSNQANRLAAMLNGCLR